MMWGSICSGGRLWLRPVELGQTRQAFYLSAVLVALWLLGRPAAAKAAYIRGSSEDQYVRLEWLYNLEDGYGFLSLSGKPDAPEDLLEFGPRTLRLWTKGVRFDSVGGPIGTRMQPPVEITIPDRSPRYEYNMSLTTLASAIGLPSLALFTFAKHGVELWPSELQYAAEVLPPPGATLPASASVNSLSFVSIQMIPEPAGAVTAIGAAALAAGMRRRLGTRKDEFPEGHSA